MRLLRAALLTLLLPSAASAAVVKTGSTCLVTPLGAAPARSIGTIPPGDRNRDPSPNADELDPDEIDLTFATNPEDEDGRPPLGAPGALGAYPRPMPSRGSRPPTVRAAGPMQVPMGLKRKKKKKMEQMVADSEADGEGWAPLESKRKEVGKDLGVGTLDDTAQVVDAFRRCGKDGTVIFAEGTYYFHRVMNTTGLRNCTVEIHGRFVWTGYNVDYWAEHGYEVSYEGGKTAWLLGGRDVRVQGYGHGMFDGNGQVWIDRNRNRHRPTENDGRPIALTIWEGTNIVVDGIKWQQAQGWHLFVANSRNVTLTNLEMDTVTDSTWRAVGTDGADTWNSRDVYIVNWVVTGGDACISIKGNSDNVHVKNVTCYNTNGMSIGVVGSHGDQTEYVQNVVFENLTLYDSVNVARIMTHPGKGHVKNITFRNIQFENVNQPIYLSSCIDSQKNCEDSRFKISDILWENVVGTSRFNVAACIHCSNGMPCENIKFSGVDITQLAGGREHVLCSNVKNQASLGLSTTGPCPVLHPQKLEDRI